MDKEEQHKRHHQLIQTAQEQDYTVQARRLPRVLDARDIQFWERRMEWNIILPPSRRHRNRQLFQIGRASIVPHRQNGVKVSASTLKRTLGHLDQFLKR